MSSWLQGAAALGILLVLSVLISVRRPLRLISEGQPRRLVGIGLLAWLAQALHFTEEYVAGFWGAFPTILGLEPWSRGAFALFNVVWLSIWLLSIWAAARTYRLAEWPLWFLALALTLNGIAHPILSVLVEGYFPGLWTALLAGIVGAALLRELARASRRPTSAPAVELGRR